MNNPKKKSIPRWTMNAILVCISSLIGLLLCEVTIRALGLTSRDIVLSRGMLIDEHCGFRLRPNTTLPEVPGIMPQVKINSLGMRDQEYTLEKPENTIRIVALGDSFAYGRVHYDFNFLTLLEEKLNRNTDRKVEILNTGVPAYQPVNQLAYLKAYGFSFQPDIVLLCFYIGNDIRNNDLAPTEIHPETPIQKEEQAHNFPLYQWLHWSELYWTVLNIMAKAQILNEIERRIPQFDINDLKDPRRIDPEFWMFSLEDHKKVLESQMRNYVAPQYRIEWDKQNLKHSIQVIEEMAQECHAREIRFITAFIPSEEQVHDDVRQLFLEVIQGKLDRSQLDFDEPQKSLLQNLSDKGIPTIDLLPEFREKGKSQRLYLLRDTHWNEAGNALAADILAQPMRELIRQTVQEGGETE